MWTIIFPRNTALMTSHQLRDICLGTTCVVVLPVIYLICTTLVPIALPLFLTAVIETVGASLLTSAVDAVLQAIRTSSLSPGGVDLESILEALKQFSLCMLLQTSNNDWRKGWDKLIAFYKACLLEVFSKMWAEY